MHYIPILCVVGFITFATGGHSETFGESYDAAMSGEVDRAVDLFVDAVRSTLNDADTKHTACSVSNMVVLMRPVDALGSPEEACE